MSTNSNIQNKVTLASEAAIAPSDSTTNKEQLKQIKIPNNISYHNIGINLIPSLSKEEVRVEETKTTFNLGGALLFMVLAVFAISVFGFNLLSKLSLNTEKERLTQLEATVRSKSAIIRDNNKILDRIKIYNKVETETYSPGEVMNYWRDISNQYGLINNIQVSNGLDFKVSGNSTDISSVSKLWHILSEDERIVNINLTALNAAENNSVSFRFEGRFNADYFINQASQNREQSQQTSNNQEL